MKPVSMKGDSKLHPRAIEAKRRSRGWTRVAVLVSVPIVTLSAAVQSAQAHSTGVPCNSNHGTKVVVGGNENNNLRLGNRADIWVNNFATAQHRTWRMVWIRFNSSFNAEAGWILDSVNNQGAHPFKTWVQNGVTRSLALTVNLTKDAFHDFRVHDQDHDHNWSFSYDGIAMGNEFVNMDWGTPIDESERTCGSDSLWSHHRNLQNIGCTNCGWQPYSSLQQYIDQALDYNFCRISTTEFQVKQSC